MQELSRYGLGASEIAAVAGLNPAASPWDVWMAKTGQSVFVGNEFTDWGQRLEPAIRQAYADKTKHEVEVPTSSMFHPLRQWQRATPDGIVYAADRSIDRLFQAKNVGEWQAKRMWEDGVPDHVQLQEQWEMDVTGAVVADVAALVGGNDFRIATVHYDARLAADLVEIGAEFMRRLERGQPPEVDHSKVCKDHLAARMRKARSVEYQADAESDAAIESWRRLHVEAKRIEQQLDKARNVVRRVFADAQCDRVSWSGGLLRIQSPRTSVTVDYEAVARLVASAKGMTAAEFESLVAEQTTTKNVAPVLSAPASWKDQG